MQSLVGRALGGALLAAASFAMNVTPGLAAPTTAPAVTTPALGQAQFDRDTGRPDSPGWPRARYSRPLLRNILREAAVRHHVDPKLVLAISYWESGWDPWLVSATGAVGVMQVEPYAAADAGPALLGRSVDIEDPFDNADVGVAILREDLDSFGDTSQALAAYYQGPASL